MVLKFPRISFLQQMPMYTYRFGVGIVKVFFLYLWCGIYSLQVLSPFSLTVFHSYPKTTPEPSVPRMKRWVLEWNGVGWEIVEKKEKKTHIIQNTKTTCAYSTLVELKHVMYLDITASCNVNVYVSHMKYCIVLVSIFILSPCIYTYIFV